MITETVHLKTTEDMEKDAALVMAIFNSTKDREIIQALLDTLVKDDDEDWESEYIKYTQNHFI